MLKTPLILFSAILAQSCSMSFVPEPPTPRDYDYVGTSNLKLITKASSSFGQSLSLLIYEFYPGCKMRQLGSREIPLNETTPIAVPAGNIIEINGNHVDSNWFMNSKNSLPVYFFFKVMPNKKYELDFQERDGSVGSSLYEITKKGRVEIENSPVENCKNWTELK
jgi:hypothetical protein